MAVVVALVFGVLWLVSKTMTWPEYFFSGTNGGNNAESTQDPDQVALKALKSALTKNPNDIDLRWQYAQLLLKLGDGSAASPHVERVYAERQTEEVELARLQILILRGFYEKALALADKLESRFTHVSLYLFRAQAKQKLGQDAGAKADFDRVLRVDPANIRARLELARIAMFEADFNGAETHIEQILENSPKEVEAWLIRGNLKLRRLQLDEATASFEQALRLNPDNAYARAGLAQVSLTTRDSKTAAEHLARLGDTQDRSLYVLYARGVTALENGDLNEAAQYFRQILSKDGKHFYSLRHLGVINTRQGKWALAKLRLEQAAAIQPQDYIVLLTTAQLHRAMQQFDSALAALRALTGLHPKSPEVQYELALTYAAQERPSEADAAFERALQLKVDYLPAQIAVGRRRLERGDSAGALIVARQLQATRLGAAAGHALEGGVRMADGDADLAIPVYRKAMAIAPSAALAVDLALAHRAQGDNASAAKLLKDWATKHPNDPDTHLALAGYALKIGDTQAAIAANNKVLALNGENPAALRNLVDLYEDSEPSRAAEFARRAFEQAPHDVLLQEKYGWLLVQSGAVRQGLQILEKAYSVRPDRRLLRYRRAVALARAELPDEARAELSALLSLDDQDAVAEQAADWLKRLGGP